MAERRGAKKKNGNVKLHPAYRGSIPKNEYETGEWLAKEFGWNIMVDKENTRGRDKAYVDLFNGYKWWEEKTPSSFTAIRTRLKNGLHQMAEMRPKTRGGIILNIANDDKINGFSDADIKREVVDVIHENSRVDCYVIIRRCGKLIAVYKVRHKK